MVNDIDSNDVATAISTMIKFMHGGFGLGIWWYVWGLYGFWWGVWYGAFWPVWVGFRLAKFILGAH